MAKEKGVMTDDKGTYIPVEKRLPYAPDNIHMSKAEFLESQKKRKEKELRIKEAAESFDREQGLEKKEAKPGKRPKKIE